MTYGTDGQTDETVAPTTDYRDFINVGLNEEERIKLDIFKLMVGQDKDSTAFKEALIMAISVAHLFSRGTHRVNLLKMKLSERRKLAELEQKLCNKQNLKRA